MTEGRWRELSLAIQLPTLELKLDAFVWALKRRYRPDQPRAPRGTPIGGQWIEEEDDRVDVAARRTGARCEGFAGGCQNGGSFGSSGITKIGGKTFCWDCALKYLGIENESRDEQLRILKLYDRLLDD